MSDNQQKAKPSRGIPGAGAAAIQSPSGGLSEAAWGAIFVLPYVVVFLAFAVMPVIRGLGLGLDWDSYVRLWNDPIYIRTVWNTAILVGVGVNLKLLLALFLSGFLLMPFRWVKLLALVFILPWAVPQVPSILSIRWMLNADWGMVNHILETWFGIWPAPAWLNDPKLAMGAVVMVHVWKWVPFWTLIMMAGRLAIPTSLYEAADVDGATTWQKFRYVTFPQIRNLYITSTLLSAIWTLGDFNSVFLLTGGGPVDRTHILATLGVRYGFNLGDLHMGVASVLTAMPVVLPCVFILVRRLNAAVKAS